MNNNALFRKELELLALAKKTFSVVNTENLIHYTRNAFSDLFYESETNLKKSWSIYYLWKIYRSIER